MASADAAKPGSTPGAGAIAGAILLRDTLARTDIDDRTKAVLTKQLRGVLPGQVVQPGGTLDQRTAGPADLTALARSAAVSAAGLDPATTPSPPPPVLWESGGNRLLSGRPLIVGTLAADRSGLSVLPMARHSFVQTGTLP